MDSKTRKTSAAKPAEGTTSDGNKRTEENKCCDGMFCCSSNYHNALVASLFIVAILIVLSLACQVFKLLGLRRSSSRN